MTESQRIARLTPPGVRPIPILLDTDTYNEVDDQFCLAYALLSEAIDLQAVYAAPFHNEHSDSAEDGMERSYDEIFRVYERLNMTPGCVLKGSRQYMADAHTPVDSPAARDIVRRVMAQPEGQPLYVVGLGCPTNIASAILMEPAIIEKMVVVWLGGTRVGCWDTATEFNLMQDLHASRVLYDCGVPLVVMPTEPVVDHLLVTLPELHYFLDDASPLGQYLLNVVHSWWVEHEGGPVWSKVIWDIVCIGYLLHPEAVLTHLIHSPILTDDCRYAVDESRHLIAEAYAVDRDVIFYDIYKLLGSPRLKD